MEAKACMIAWNPGTAEIAVMPWPDTAGRSDRYLMTGGACYLQWCEADETNLALLVQLAFHACVVRDGIPVQAAHEAFLEIDEYRDRIAPDIAGAQLF